MIVTLERAIPSLLGSLASVALLSADAFQQEVRPVLVKHCQGCHSPDSENRIRFLEAESIADISSDRGLWSNVAMQLRNRTMPPTGPQPSEHDRFKIATWIDRTLRDTACDIGEHARPVTLRRLNRAEYQNTIRDLFGARLQVAELFPVDGSGGEGFDNNAETLYLSPLLAERYLEVADRILDAVIVRPPLGRAFTGRDLFPERHGDAHDSVEMTPGDSVSREVSFYEDSDYEISSWIRSPDKDDEPVIKIIVDGAVRGQLHFSWSAAEATSRKLTIPFARGQHRLTVSVPDDSLPLRLVSLDIDQEKVEPTPGKRAAHFRLFGRDPGEAVLDSRREASRLLRRFLVRAFRRPLRRGEAEPYLSLFDRSARRGDPFEESIRTALKAVLVSPDFLFRVEDAPESPGLHPLSNHELATRLSYFLWGSMPDSELTHLADAGRLQDDQVLAAQVDRLIEHPRSRFLARTFIGQWLGTKDVGGRVAPTLNEIQHFYTPQIAADMREEPVLLFQRMLNEDRSLLELIDADYTYLTERLARHYGMPEAVQGNDFRLVSVSDGRRGGLLGSGAVQAMNAAYKRTSPVLRGVWVLDVLLGTRIPSPPPDTPPLESEESDGGGFTIREMLDKHRANASCAACHDLIDPIGFGLENYDWLGRWRDVDDEGRPVDATGILPSGEVFRGPGELREVLLRKKDQLIRHITQKILGYALGRGVSDRDQCTIETLIRSIESSNFGTRSLVREVVLSVPFRHVQADVGAGSSQLTDNPE